MTQKTWFITGINSGFGRHMCEQLLERSDTVAGTVRKLDAVAELKDAYPDRLWLAQRRGHASDIRAHALEVGGVIDRDHPHPARPQAPRHRLVAAPGTHYDVRPGGPEEGTPGRTCCGIS